MWDVHCHIFPRRYIKELSSLHEIGISPPDSLGRNILYDKETKQTLTYFIEGTPHVDVNKHLEDMREFGIEKQFLSVSPPHLDKIKEPRRALQLSQAINDGLSEIVDVDREHLSALATLPTTDLSLAMDELRRIIKLGLPGVALPSNTAKRFYDEGYDDLFKEISSKGLLLFIHPTEPVVWDRLGEDYNLALLYGWPFDTTLSVARLVFSGTIARYPGLKVVVSHGGGMIPFFAGRVKLLGKDMRGKGKVIAVEDPLADFKRLYYDTAFFNVPSLKLLLEFVGEDHVVMGTDYPFGQRAGRACYEETLQMINRALTCEQREKVCKLNMTKLLHR